MKILGIDIGGANTDCSIIALENNNVHLVKTFRDYFPMWKNNEILSDYLEKIREKEAPDIVCVSMTAELADCYKSKKEGVLDISKRVVDTFGTEGVYFVSVDGLKCFDDLKSDLLSAAASNWIGTVELLKHVCSDCVFMDMGSTSTDIIPIMDGKEHAEGHNDLERLISGELVYTGLLRSNLASIVHNVPIRGENCGVSSEYFSITADVHMILENISEDEYTCPTPDGMGSDVLSCKRRLARLVCADLDLLGDDEINAIAKFIEEKQIAMIYNGLKKVVSRTKLDTVILSSMKNNVCKKVVKKMDLNVLNLEDLLKKEHVKSITAVGAVQMYLNKYYPNLVIV